MARERERGWVGVGGRDSLYLHRMSMREAGVGGREGVGGVRRRRGG